MANEYHEANRRGWDEVSVHWQKGVGEREPWDKCHLRPDLVLLPEEIAVLGDLKGRKACVLGSGDNLAVFALAGMGAEVTSVDISRKQMDIAAGRAEKLGLKVEFVRADVTDLSGIADESYDVVYTGGHVAVWVSDLGLYYREAGRILKKGGLFLVNEYHPVRRVWRWVPDRLEVEFNYFDRGPFKYDRSEEVPGAEAGSLPSYEFHWTIAEFCDAFLKSGCDIFLLKEAGDRREWYEVPPLQGLPKCLILAGKKKGIPT